MPRDSLTQNLETLRIDHDRRAGDSPRLPRFVGYVMVALILGLVVWLVAAFSRAPVVAVARVVALETREPSAVLVAGGYVVAHHKIQLSSKVVGKVAWIGVEKGDVVEQGQVLVRLENNEYRAAVEQAAGNLAAAEARLRQLEAGSRPQEIEHARAQAEEAHANLLNAQLQLGRAEGLARDGVLSTRELDNARATFEMARAQAEAADKQYELVQLGPRGEEIDFARGQVEQARGALNYARTQLEATQIRSPIRGTVLERLVEHGEMVTTMFVGERGAKSSVVTLADLNDLQVELDINQNDFARIQPRQACTVVADAYPDHRYRCVVDEIAPEANRQKATVQVKVKVLGPDGRLRPEMNARVSFHAPGGGQVKGMELLVPRAAIFQAAEKPAVMAVENSRAVLKTVTLGEAAGDSVRITTGLTGNESVVVSNPGSLKNGQRVRVR